MKELLGSRAQPRSAHLVRGSERGPKPSGVRLRRVAPSLSQGDVKDSPLSIKDPTITSCRRTLSWPTRNASRPGWYCPRIRRASTPRGATGIKRLEPRVGHGAESEGHKVRGWGVRRRSTRLRMEGTHSVRGSPHQLGRTGLLPSSNGAPSMGLFASRVRPCDPNLETRRDVREGGN